MDLHLGDRMTTTATATNQVHRRHLALATADHRA
jgi:hypothetical protein